MKTSIIKSNGVRDSTEEKIIQNWAAEYAKMLVEKEAEERKQFDNAHASKLASGTEYGHVKLSDSTSSSSNINDAVAATPQAVKKVYDKAFEAIKDVAEIMSMLNTESAVRQNADILLENKISSEVRMRETADAELQKASDALLEAVKILQDRLKLEEHDRRTDDNILMGNVEILCSIAHRHNNKDILDGITAERIEQWNDIPDFKSFITLAQQIIYGNVNQFRDVYAMIGIKQYDGGLFGMEYEGGAYLDGGSFNDTEIRQVIDGGTFAAVSSVLSRVENMETILGTLESELDKING